MTSIEVKKKKKKEHLIQFIYQIVEIKSVTVIRFEITSSFNLCLKNKLS